MNLLIISDLHIGKGDNFDTFGWDEIEFISAIERIRKFMNIEKIILNGDIYELMKFKMKEIKLAYPKIVDYFKNDYFIYLKGNHDFLNNTGDLFFKLENSTGKKIHIEHGHNADFLNGTRVGRFISNLSFRLLKKITKFDPLLKIYLKIIEFDDQIHRIPRKYDSVKYLHYALKLLEENDVVILGHTHKIEVHKTYYLNNKKKYLNCGSCSLGRFQAIVLDTETLRYETIKLNKKSKIKNFLNELEGNITLQDSLKVFQFAVNSDSQN
ncbi:MAG: hypothetical protein Fur0015_10930 [Ignavibacteriales bacterium]